MSGAESDQTPIARLEQAVHTLPPDVRAARAAIAAFDAEVQGMGDEERGPLLMQVSQLSGELAVAGVNADVTQEFGAHRDQYGALARGMGVVEAPQVVPTRTIGKQMAGGKQ